MACQDPLLSLLCFLWEKDPASSPWVVPEPPALRLGTGVSGVTNREGPEPGVAFESSREKWGWVVGTPTVGEGRVPTLGGWRVTLQGLELP